jgi:hypothetical protein
MNLRDHIIEWLDSLGADGLMKLDWEDGPIAITPDDIVRDKDAHLHLQLVPAFRHADGTYHTEPEPCFNCERGHRPECMTPDVPCYWYQPWLSHKEETK